MVPNIIRLGLGFNSKFVRVTVWDRLKKKTSQKQLSIAGFKHATFGTRGRHETESLFENHVSHTYLKVTLLAVAPSGRFPRHHPTSSDMDGDIEFWLYDRWPGWVFRVFSVGKYHLFCFRGIQNKPYRFCSMTLKAVLSFFKSQSQAAATWVENSAIRVIIHISCFNVSP